MNDFFTTELIIKSVSMFIASIAFSIVCKIDKRHLIFAGALGTLTYLIYYTALYFNASLFVAAFVSTSVTALCSEILARLRHAPTLVFSLAAVIPTVPGGNLYYAMRGLLSNNLEEAGKNFVITLTTGLGIAGGIVTVSIIFAIATDVIKKTKLKLQETKNTK